MPQNAIVLTQSVSVFYKQMFLSSCHLSLLSFQSPEMIVFDNSTQFYSFFFGGGGEVAGRGFAELSILS